jgi:hypothetical protein
MPQADSLTNVLIIAYAIPLFILTSFLNDETAEEEELDISLEIFMDYAFQGDNSCCLLDGITQIIFSAMVGFSYLFSINSLNTKYSSNSGLWTVLNLGYRSNSFIGVNTPLIEELEIASINLIDVKKI